MKLLFRKSLAIVMAVVICTGVLFGLGFSAQAATVNYNTASNGYVYNWGQRGTDATFMSPMATAFYQKNNTSLNALLALSGSSSESSVPSSSLYKKLQSLMKDNHDYVTNYDATKDLFKYTDCQNGGGKISSFYSGKAIGPAWNGNEWNREHTWPNSKGDKAGSGENDLMMLRPTSTSENSSRGNTAYGESSSYYHPNEESNGAYDLRGDVARIVLYVYVRWNCTNTGSGYNPNGIFGSGGVIESKKVLLDWIKSDPVDTWELGRNDAAESILGTRNVFVDYPELAFDLFNEAIPSGYTSPSNGQGSSGDSGSGGTQPDTPSQPETPVEPDEPDEPDTPVEPEKPTTPSGSYYQKVTTAPSDWSGDYLIVYETGNLAFNGGLTTLDAVKDTISVTINDNIIAANDATNAAKFTIAKSGDAYTIKSASGYYIGRTGDSNGLNSSKTTTYTNTISLNSNGSAHIVSSGKAILRFNAASDQMRFRYYKTSSYTGQKAIHLYKYVEAPVQTLSAEISGAQVVIGENLSINYYTDIKNLGDSKVKMRFTLGDDDSVTVTSYQIVDGKYVFNFNNLAPQRMTDVIVAELLVDDEVIATKSDYSIRQNAKNLLSNNPSSALKQLIADMLYYGAAAQSYRGYKTNDLAYSGVSGISPSSAVPEESDLYLSSSTAKVCFSSASVYFADANHIIVKVKNPTSNTKLVVDGKTVTLTDGVYMTDAISATDFSKIFAFDLYENNALVQTLEYSVNSYAFSKKNSSGIGSLVLALYRYGISAEGYLISQS